MNLAHCIFLVATNASHWKASEPNLSQQTETNEALRMADRLRAARQDKRMTLAKLGAALSPPRGRGIVCEWEKGRCEPSLATVEQLAAVLNVTPCWLAFGVDHDAQ